MSRMVSPFRSMRMPRENELGLAYANASLSTSWFVMARFFTGDCAMASRILEKSFILLAPNFYPRSRRRKPWPLGHSYRLISRKAVSRGDFDLQGYPPKWLFRYIIQRKFPRGFETYYKNPFAGPLHGDNMKTFSRRTLLKSSLLAPAAVAAHGMGPVGAAIQASGGVPTAQPAGATSRLATPGAGRERLLLDFGWRFHLRQCERSHKGL